MQLVMWRERKTKMQCPFVWSRLSKGAECSATYLCSHREMQRIEETLKKPAPNRTLRELQLLMNLLKEVPFFLQYKLPDKVILLPQVHAFGLTPEILPFCYMLTGVD